MAKNIDIFVCCHRPFKKIVKNDSYTNIFCGYKGDFDVNGGLVDNIGDNISNLNGFYSELTAFYWVWKNLKLKDYVGFCHYRRYFSFMDNIPTFDKEKYSIILPIPNDISFSMRKDYSFYHNVEDFDLMVKILKEKYNFDENLLNNVINDAQKMFICNMFVATKEDFEEYCELYFGVMKEFMDRRGWVSMQDIYSYIEKNSNKYLKGYYPNNDVYYQARIGGFLSERLFTIWLYSKKYKYLEYSVNITETKYKEKKDDDFIVEKC